jgi:hypothetical protein
LSGDGADVYPTRLGTGLAQNGSGA